MRVRLTGLFDFLTGCFRLRFSLLSSILPDRREYDDLINEISNSHTTRFHVKLFVCSPLSNRARHFLLATLCRFTVYDSLVEDPCKPCNQCNPCNNHCNHHHSLKSLQNLEKLSESPPLLSRPPRSSQCHPAIRRNSSRRRPRRFQFNSTNFFFCFGFGFLLFLFVLFVRLPFFVVFGRFTPSLHWKFNIVTFISIVYAAFLWFCFFFFHSSLLSRFQSIHLPCLLLTNQSCAISLPAGFFCLVSFLY